MNSKISLLIGVMFVAGMSCVSAHETGVPHEEPAAGTAEVQLVPIAGDDRKPVMPTSVKGNTQGGVQPGTPRPEDRAMDKGMQARAMRAATGSVPAVGVASGKLTTGDTSIDAQVQALNVEMEAKIKVIRDEYAAKIKALVGDKKVVPVVASTTRMDDRGGDRMMESGERNASSTRSIGESQGNFLKNFFGRFFGR